MSLEKQSTSTSLSTTNKKKCPTHKELFPKEAPIRFAFEFYNTPSRYDGLSSHCKRCSRIKRRIERGGVRRADNMPGGRAEAHFSVPTHLKERLVQYAEDRGISQSRVINEALEFYLEDAP